MSAADTFALKPIPEIRGWREVVGRNINIYVADSWKGEPDLWAEIRKGLPGVGDRWGINLPASQVHDATRHPEGMFLNWCNRSGAAIYSGIIGSYDPTTDSYPVTRTL